MEGIKYLKYGLMGLVLIAGITFAGIEDSSADTTQSIKIGGWAFNGWEQGREATQITYMLELVAGKGSISGGASGRNSAYQFEAKNSAHFSLGGVDLGTNITVIHSQDWIGVANNLCAGDVTKCNFVDQWGREAKTLSVVSPKKATRQSTSGIEIGGWAFNGHEQGYEAEAISQALILAQGNGGVSGGASYRDSYYNFTATNGNYFTLDGVNIGNKISIVHHQDWIGLTKDNTCGWGVACNFFDSWGRGNKQLGVHIPNLVDSCCASSCRSKPASCTPTPPLDPVCPVGLVMDAGACVVPTTSTTANPATQTSGNSSCALPGGWSKTSIAVGEKVRAYENYYRVSDQACFDASEERVCQANGVLSGSFQYEGCTVPPPPPPPPPPVQGQTGSACDTMTSADTATFLAGGSALCRAGSVSDFRKTFENYSWTCAGYYGGGSQSCSAPRIVNNVGGSSCGVAFYAKPTGNLCAEGVDPVVTGNGPWVWECAGGNGGSSAKCTAEKKTDGSCGSVAQYSYGTAPTSNQCSKGVPTQSLSDTTGKFWQWTCSGQNGGSALSCKTANSCGNGICEASKGETSTTCKLDCKSSVTGVNEI